MVREDNYMKTLTFIFASCLIISGCAKRNLDVQNSSSMSCQIPEIFEYYPNGKKKSEYHCRDGKQHGLTTKWFENGQKELEIYFIDGKMNGLATNWYENGQKEFEIIYADGRVIKQLISYGEKYGEKGKENKKESEKPTNEAARKFVNDESKNYNEQSKTTIADKKDDSLFWGRNEFENNVQIMVFCEIHEQSSFRGYATGGILETNLFDNGVIETKFKLYFHESDNPGNWEKAKYGDGDDVLVAMTDRKSNYNNRSVNYVTTIDFRFLNLNKSDSHGLKLKMYDPKTQQLAEFVIGKSDIDKLKNKVKDLKPDVIYNIVAKAFKEERYSDGVGWAVAFLQEFPGHENGKVLSRSLIEIYSSSKEKQKAKKIYDDAIRQYASDVQFCTNLTELYKKSGVSSPTKQSKHETTKTK